MKILFITNGFPPLRWAGTETYTAGIAEEIASRGHEARVLCIGEWDKGDAYWNGVDEDMEGGIPVQRINLNWAKSPDPFRYLYDNPLVAEYLTNLLREVKPDLVHVTSCETLSASIFRVVKNARIPLVFSITDFWFLCPRINLLHSNGSNCNGQTTSTECLDCMLGHNQKYQHAKKITPKKAFLSVLGKISQYPVFTRRRGLRGMAGNMAERKAMLKHALTLPDYRITASNFVREIYVANNVDVPIEVYSYGHDLDWLKTYKGKSKSAIIRFGYIGQIIEAKGVHLILDAMSHLPKEDFDRFSIVIYGNLEHTPSYGQRIRELAFRFPNVSFGGTYPHAESSRIFSEIDVLLVPSVWYDFPLIIYEAFATQTPVIATNLGGMAETILNNKDGLLFERGSEIDLSRQMKKLLDEPGLLEKLASGTPRVKTVREEVDKLEDKYFELVRKNKEKDIQEQ